MKKLLSAILVAGVVVSSPGAEAAQAPLSCDMKTLLVGMAALNRDIGVTRDQSPIAKNPDGELTKAEIKWILDKVYVQGAGKSPDAIKDAVYRQYKHGR